MFIRKECIYIITINENLTILIVDDESSIRNGLSKAINWEELNVRLLGTAQDGLEAFEFIKKHKPDLVITDIKMPNLDGLQLINKVKELKLNTKFIIISGYDDFKYAQTAIKYGVKSYLLKPIKKSELINEVSSISNDFLLEKSLNKSSNNNLSITNHSLKENFFSHLLQNEYKQTDEINNQIKNLELSIEDKPSQVVVFNYEYLSNIKDTAKKASNTLLKSTIKNIVEELLANTNSVTFEYVNNYVVCIINIDSLKNTKTENITDFCNECINIIKKNDNFRDAQIYVGIGDIINSLLLANESYLIALESLSYKIYETPQRIFDSHIISHDKVQNMSASTMDNSALIDAIYIGNIEDMLNFTTNFFNSFFKDSTPPPNFIRGMSIYLVIDIQKGLSVYLDKNTGLFNEKPYITINQLPFLSQIKDWIIDLFTDYIYHIKETCKYKKDPIIEKAKAYINDNISKRLKVDDVAANVNLSTNYFTVYFKQKTNENVSNYISNLKIENAKKLLKTTTQPISEIAFLLGYEDYRSFNRVFKKNTKKSPTDFRKLYNSTD